jgi:hypothetical protein
MMTRTRLLAITTATALAAMGVVGIATADPDLEHADGADARITETQEDTDDARPERRRDHDRMHDGTGPMHDDGEGMRERHERMLERDPEMRERMAERGIDPDRMRERMGGMNHEGMHERMHDGAGPMHERMHDGAGPMHDDGEGMRERHERMLERDPEMRERMEERGMDPDRMRERVEERGMDPDRMRERPEDGMGPDRMRERPEDGTGPGRMGRGA